MKREQDFFEKLELTNEKAKCINDNKNNINDEVGNGSYNTVFYSKNTIANILKSIAWVALGLGFILGFVMSDSKYDEINFLYLIQIWAIYGSAFVGIYGFGEIIQILHDIREKLTENNKD